jgi:hypothetical protein
MMMNDDLFTEKEEQQKKIYQSFFSSFAFHHISSRAIEFNLLPPFEAFCVHNTEKHKQHQ